MCIRDSSTPRSVNFWKEHDTSTPTRCRGVLSVGMPATPQSHTKRKLVVKNNVEVIEICSSPATPRSSRHMMSSWLASSPRSGGRDSSRGAQTDVAAWRPPPFALTAQSRSPVLPPAMNNQDIPFMDCTSEEPSTATVELRLIQSRTAAQSHAKRAKRLDMIRLRDSLDGAWTMDEPNARSAAKRGAPRGEAGKAVKQWRRSQVETLDLTGL